MTFEDVCNILNLDNTPDWGISNSDGLRVSEFINFISTNNSVQLSIQYEFVELITASMNDAIIKGVANCELIEKFCCYSKSLLKSKIFYPQFEYWISIKSKEEYPVGLLLESYMKNNPLL